MRLANDLSTQQNMYGFVQSGTRKNMYRAIKCLFAPKDNVTLHNKSHKIKDSY